VVQASGAAAGPVLARALVRDLWDEGPAARLLGLVGGIMAVAPAVAPIAGGLLDIRFGWTASFWTLCLLGVGAAGIAAAVLPETVSAGAGRQGRSALRDLRMLLGDSGFARQIGGLGLLYGGMLAYVSVAPFVLIRDMGLRPDLFGVSYTVIVAGYALGSLAVARRGRSTGDLRLFLVGGGLVAVAGPLLAAVLAGGAPAGAAVAAMAVYMSGFGILVPLVTARAIGRRPGAYGSAAALLGASEMAVAALCGAVATALLGVLGAQAMALVTALCGGVAVLLLLPTPRTESSGG
jgi:DHA1 family bicyclomycin/chloramphenicol resistance-like MFS transporter